MFRISAITRVGLVAVACVAVAAPSALAKSPVKAQAKSLYGYAMSYTPTKATPKSPYGYAMSYRPTKPAKAAKAQSVKKAAPSGNNVQGCQNGTPPDRAVGGDNNDYEYLYAGDICTVSAPPADPVVSENTDYEYIYGGKR